jgi:hypothetical protein
MDDRLTGRRAVTPLGGAGCEVSEVSAELAQELPVSTLPSFSSGA